MKDNSDLFCKLITIAISKEPYNINFKRYGLLNDNTLDGKLDEYARLRLFGAYGGWVIITPFLL